MGGGRWVVGRGLRRVPASPPPATRHPPPTTPPHGAHFALVVLVSEVIRCPACGQANRVPDLGEGKTAVCGKCKAPLTGDAHPVTVTDAGFQALIGDGRATIVDFWAPWCGPCRMIAPLLEEIAAEQRDVRIAKLNVDENPRTAAAFHVQGIPLLVFFKDGVERGRVVGAVPRGQLDAAIRQYFG
jgi:thioredoxin 2